MRSALEIIETVEVNGGRIRVEDGSIVIAPGNAAAPVIDELRAHKAEIIALLQSRITQVEATIDEGWGEWLLEKCTYIDGWWGGTGPLHLNLAGWCADRGRPAPQSRRAFVSALQAEGFAVTTDSLVYGLVLREDLEAHLQFLNPPGKAKSAAQNKRTRRAR